MAVTDRPAVTRASSRGRLVALDGLRGIAALVVVFHHVYQIARPFLEPEKNAWAVGTLWWLISSTPIKLLSAGSEAVLVFFVLSGLVVPLAASKGRGFSWSGFLTARFVRLCLPVWASLALAALSINLIPRDLSNVTDGSWLARANATATHFDTMLGQATLTRNSYTANSVLWSLQWELVFSILLPVFLFMARALRRYWLPAILTCFGLTVVGKLVDVDALLYLPVFFMGTMILVNLDGIREWADRRRGRRGDRTLWWLTLVGSSLAIVVSWMARPVIPAGTLLSDALGSLTSLGAAGLVLTAIVFPPVIRGLSARAPQWLGRVSFSLYLVHLPILATLAFLLGDDQWWLVALIGIPLSLATAWGFFLVVEAPSHRLSRRVGALVETVTQHATIRLRAGRVRRMATAG